MRDGVVFFIPRLLVFYRYTFNLFHKNPSYTPVPAYVSLKFSYPFSTTVLILSVDLCQRKGRTGYLCVWFLQRIRVYRPFLLVYTYKRWKMKMKYINSLCDMINAARNGFVCARFISVRIYVAVSLKVFPFIYIHVLKCKTTICHYIFVSYVL